MNICLDSPDLRKFTKLLKYIKNRPTNPTLIPQYLMFWESFTSKEKVFRKIWEKLSNIL